ncbi:MAG: VWA domain-containing protein [Phycisphaerae bacterium]|nr:VWA domain-containing protein [Phycisphaerae bacterium]
MTLLNPILAAVGAACIAIPIAIHLLMRRRRQPVPWAAMRFLLEALRQHRRRLRLEQLLLLGARCLLVLLIALALGRPMLGASGALAGRGQTTLYLLIDNGLASAATDGTTDALTRHKAAAARLLAQLDANRGDRAALVALAGPAASVVMPPSSDLSGVAEAVRSLAPAQSATDLPGGLALVRDAIEPSASSRSAAVVLCDFLAGSADVGRRPDGGASPLTVLASLPSETGADNATVLEAEPMRPLIIAGVADASGGGASAGGGVGGGTFAVRVAVRRSGPWVARAGATTIRVGVGPEGSASLGQGTIRWLAGQSEATASVSIESSAVVRGAQAAGTAMLWASIDRDAIAGDDTRFRPVQVRPSVRVGVVSPRRSVGRAGLTRFEAEDWVRLALSPEETTARASEIDVSEVEPLALDAARLASLDAAIVTRPEAIAEPVWRRLRGFVDAGGLLVVVPPAGASVHLWPDTLASEMAFPWTAGRQAREISAGLAPSADEPPADDLLALVRAELPDLMSAVRVRRVLAFEPAAGADKAAPLLRLADGSPWIVAGRPGGAESGRAGMVVVLGSALDFEWTDVMAKPLMVPLLNELVRQGVGRASGAWAVVAGTAPPAPAGAVELRSGASTLPVNAGRASGPVRVAGVWRAVDERGASRGLVAINADAAGGKGEAQARSTVESWLASLAGGQVRFLDPSASLSGGSVASGNAEQGGSWAWWLLVAALAAAVVELALGRWFSHAVIKAEPAR